MTWRSRKNVKQPVNMSNATTGNMCLIAPVANAAGVPNINGFCTQNNSKHLHILTEASAVG